MSLCFAIPGVPIRIILACDEQIDIPNSVLLLIEVPTELSQTVFPTVGQQEGVRTNFVQEVPRDLQGLTISVAIHVVEDLSIKMDILTLEL